MDPQTNEQRQERLLAAIRAKSPAALHTFGQHKVAYMRDLERRGLVVVEEQNVLAATPDGMIQVQLFGVGPGPSLLARAVELGTQPEMLLGRLAYYMNEGMLSLQ